MKKNNLLLPIKNSAILSFICRTTIVLFMVLSSIMSHAELMKETYPEHIGMTIDALSPPIFSSNDASPSGILELNNSYINIEPLTLTGDFTIESWVYFDSNNLINNQDGIVAGANQDINFHNGNIRVHSGSDRVIANTLSATEEWTHYAVVRRNGSTSIYINGQLDATSQNTWNEAFSIEHLGTGLAGVSNGTGSSARFDDVLIWDSARSVNQITSDMRRNIEATGDLLRHYSFDDEASMSEEIFNGTGAGVDIEPQTLTGDFTIQAWMFFAEGDPINNEDGIVAGASQDINFHNGRIRVHDRNTGGDQVIANTAATTGVWTHYAIVREAGRTSLYINGILDATSTTTWTNDFTFNRKGTGLAGIPLNTGLNGRMSDFEISNEALSVNEIREVILSSNEEIFNGSGAGVDFETQTLIGDFTVQAWMFFAEGSSINNQDGIVASTIQDINFANGNIRVHDRNAGGDQVIANTAATTGVWAHYAIVREAGRTSIYIDGVLDATSATIWTNDFTFSRRGTSIAGINRSTGLVGRMSNLQISNEALSLNEIGGVAFNPTSSNDGDNNAGGGLNPPSDGADFELRNGARILTSNGDNNLDVNEAILAIESLTLTGDFTIESWVNFNNNTAITSQDGLVASESHDINFHQGRIRLFSNREDIVIANTSAVAGVMTHYAIVRRNGITSIYINGQLDATAASNWNNDFIIDHIGTGIRGVTNGIGLDGQMNDFVIWNTARSAAQISDDMNNISLSNDVLTYYSFCGIGPIALDESGNDRNLALISGAILENGDNGNNGGDDTTIEPISGNRAVQVSNSRLSINEVTLTDGFSISAWVYFDENDAINGNDILAQGDGWIIDFDNGVFNVSVAELGGSIVATNTPIEPGKWAFYTAVRDEEGFVELFINGNFERSSKIDDSSTRGTVNDPWTTNIVVSEIYTGMNAVIDDFRIYNTPRSQTQLQSDLTGTLQGVGGLVRYYSFDGEVDAIIDNSGNSGDLARENGTEFTGFIAPFVVPRVANAFSTSQVALDLILPTDLDFLPDNRLIVVEKSGLVKIFADGTQVGSESAIYLDLSDVTNNEGERGMLAVVVDPDFENNGYVYLYNTFINANNTISKAVVRYTHIEGTGGANSRLDRSSAFIIWREQEVPLAQAANVHHGGGLDVAFEPIGANDPSPYKMYIVTSDESIPRSSGDLGSDNGKVHRINLRDGSIPTDNPYYDAVAAANYNPQNNVTSSVSNAGILTTVHSVGVRNGWRASYDQTSGFLLFGEVGGRFWEDIHVAVPRADYGWNSQEGPLNDPNDPGNPILFYPHTNGPGLNDVPSSGSASITGGVVYRGDKFPEEYQGVYFYADWTRQWIRTARFDFSGDRPVLVEDNFFRNSTGRVLSFEEGPDGALYYITTTQLDGNVFVFGGQVNRLSFDSDNTAPFGSGILVDSDDLVTGTTPHRVQFGSNVSDAEGDAITYSWSFGDGNFSSDVNPEHTYTALGEYEVRLVATDANGAATVFPSVFIRIGSVPIVTIQASQTNTYRAGDVITVDGFATDVIDGSIAPSNLSWSSSYGTAGSGRPGPFENNTPYTTGGITFTTPNFGNVESFLNSVTVSLRAENSNGLFATESITLIAETSSISIDAPNQDVLIAIDGHITTPGDYTFEGIVNFLFDFEADVQYEQNGQIFSFSHWSDQPSNTNPIRRIAMPAVPTTITPIYVNSSGGIPEGPALFDFETGDLQGATITSGSFGQIVSNREFFIIGNNVPYNNGGDYFLNTLEVSSDLPRGDDAFTGTITSPLYTLTDGEFTSLVGGGSNTNLVYLGVYLEDGTEIGRLGRNSNGESMQPMNLNLSAHVGENIYWQVVDNSTGNWGHITVDNIQFEGTLLNAPTNCNNPQNLAIGKATSQSSTFFNNNTRFGSANAVDGNTDGNHRNNSITHTLLNQQNAWWEIDLGEVSNLSSVKLWNRTNCCADRLTDFHVLVSDVPFTSTVLNTTINQNGVSDFHFPGTAGRETDINLNRTGRYLRVQLSGTNALQLAEVEIMGCNSISNASSLQVDDCTPVSISANANAITVSNLVAAVADIQILDEDNNQVARCAFNCGETESFDLLPGIYRVVVKKFSAAFAQICEKIELVTIGANLTNETRRGLKNTPGVDEKTNSKLEQDDKMALSMKIAPNPVRGQFSVNFNTIKGETYHFSVIDILSKVHHQQELIGEGGVMKLDLNSGPWEGGLYFLVLEGEEQAKVQQMVVIK